MAQDDIQELQEALSWIESIARSLGNRHQALTDEVCTQSQQATNNIGNDKKALELQLQQTGRSIANTTKISNTMTSSIPLLSFISYISSGGDVVTKRDNLVTACTDLVSNFEELTRLAGQANKRLNAIYRAAIETEDEITRLAQDLGKFQSGLCIFEDLQEDLKDSRSDLEDLEKIQATAREELREFRMYELAYDIERQHQKKAC